MTETSLAKLGEYVEEIARAWASIDGKAEEFDECKRDPAIEEEYGHYQGYLAEAHELLRRSPMTLRVICDAYRTGDEE